MIIIVHPRNLGVLRSRDQPIPGPFPAPPPSQGKGPGNEVVNDVKLLWNCSLRPVKYVYFYDNLLSTTVFFVHFPRNFTSFTRRVKFMIRHVPAPS